MMSYMIIVSYCVIHMTSYAIHILFILDSYDGVLDSYDFLNDSNGVIHDSYDDIHAS